MAKDYPQAVFYDMKFADFVNDQFAVVDGDLVLGRGDQAEIRLEDPFASSRHARVYEQGNAVVIEDLH